VQTLRIFLGGKNERCRCFWHRESYIEIINIYDLCEKKFETIVQPKCSASMAFKKVMQFCKAKESALYITGKMIKNNMWEKWVQPPPSTVEMGEFPES